MQNKALHKVYNFNFTTLNPPLLNDLQINIVDRQYSQRLYAILTNKALHKICSFVFAVLNVNCSNKYPLSSALESAGFVSIFYIAISIGETLNVINGFLNRNLLLFINQLNPPLLNDLQINIVDRQYFNLQN